LVRDAENIRSADTIRNNAVMSENEDAISSESTAYVALAAGVSVAADALRIQFARSGGPGGQNVNKLNTKAELWVPLSAIRGMDPSALARLRALAGKRVTREGMLHISAQTERTQERNRQAVFERLRLLVERALTAPKPRKRTKPSRAAKRRRLEAKRHRGEIKATRRGESDW
jgi:ribosome-associated protein